MTSYAAAPSDIAAAMELIGSHTIAISDIITHRMGLKEIGKGFQLVEKAKDSLKVIINPQN
jgi:threonine dehydrogenase-like Zn-dependent dehydrogenase